MLPACPKCNAAFPEASQLPQQVYERIELPPIKPLVTQVRLFGGRYAYCGEQVTTDAPTRHAERQLQRIATRQVHASGLG
jgi:hypothetical protein